MPYWHRRWRKRYPRYRRRTRPFRPYYRWRFRKAFRGRRTRRRRYRVRKKRVLRLLQWQPPYMRNCRIKGQMQAIICGAGRQQYNYVQHKDEVVPAKMAGGGSFAVFVFNLGFFWDEHQHWRNIWTATNENYDLLRYKGMQLKVFRAPTVDVIITVMRHYPMLVNSGTYPSTHPQRQLLSNKKYIIPSLLRKPKGKLYRKIKIKPPHLMWNRWFFAADFVNTNLCMVHIATADLTRAYCSQSGDNNCTGFNCLNTNIFQNVAWKHTEHGTIYNPQPQKKLIGLKDDKKWTDLNPMNPYGLTNPFYTTYLTGKNKVRLVNATTSTQSLPEQTQEGEDVTGNLLSYCRYNPTPDTGDENIVYVLTMLRQHGLQPPTNEQFSLKGLPVWLLLYGFLDWITKLFPTFDFYNTYVLTIQSPFITTDPQLKKQPDPNPTKYPCIVPIGPHFLSGRGVFDTDPTPKDQLEWYPKISMQSAATNLLVNTGPFIPKPHKEFSWCVQLDYTAYFKWGGTHHPSQEIDNPAKKPKYPVPNQQLKGIQIQNPRKIRELHPWHWRRDQLTRSALKRILQDSETSTDSESLSETPKKKKKSPSDPKPYTVDFQNFQESSSGTESSQISEEETEGLHQQLLQQRKKQQQLKRTLFRCLKNIQQKQRTLSILTGPME
nr:MAG: ORF1 [Torque teno midi virus]